MAYSYSTLWPLLKLQPLLLLCHPIFRYFCAFFLIFFFFFFSLSLVLSAFWCFLLSSYFSSLSGLLINVYCQMVNIFLSFDFVLLDSNERSPMLPAASTLLVFAIFKKSWEMWNCRDLSWSFIGAHKKVEWADKPISATVEGLEFFSFFFLFRKYLTIYCLY